MERPQKVGRDLDTDDTRGGISTMPSIPLFLIAFSRISLSFSPKKSFALTIFSTYTFKEH